MSVIIPTHNRAQLVGEAIESVLAQEGAGTKFDMEILVVDDASTDETPAVLGRYPQIRHIRLTENHGEGGARNAGIAASQGDYIAFLDDDDLMLPHRLGLQVAAMEAHPEVGVVYSQNIIRGENILKASPSGPAASSADRLDKTWPDADTAPSGDVFEIFLKEEFLSMDTLLVRRQAFEKAGYFETYATEAHYDMFLRLAFHVPFLFVKGNVAVNRVNTQGVFHVYLSGEGGCARMLPHVVEKALKMLPDSPYAKQLRREVHAALVPRIFCMLERISSLDEVRSYIQIAFRSCPWLATESAARQALAANAAMFVGLQDSGIAVPQLICTELKAATKINGIKDWLRMRIFLAQFWTASAVAIAFTPHGNRSASIQAMARAFLHDPRCICRADCLKLAARMVLGPSVYSYLRGLRQRPSRGPVLST